VFARGALAPLRRDVGLGRDCALAVASAQQPPPQTDAQKVLKRG
jgi:hypothetical protein